MPLMVKFKQGGEKAGYYIGCIIAFLVIFAAGLVVLWITMEPYHRSPDSLK